MKSIASNTIWRWTKVVSGVLVVALGFFLGSSIKRRFATAKSSTVSKSASDELGKSIATASSAEKRPPAFTSSSSALGSQFTPGSANYDPTKAVSVLPLQEIFAQEPRNEEWAGKTEQFLASGVSVDFNKLFPGVGAPIVECHTATCKIALDPSVDVKKQFEAYAWLYGGSIYTAKDGAIYASFAGGTHSDIVAGDPDSLKQKMTTRRNNALRAIRRGQAPNVFVSMFSQDQLSSLEEGRP